MNPVPEDLTLAPWKRLGESLEGSFAARARGLLAPDFAILDRDGEEIGCLEIRGPQGAEVAAGDLEARIERSAHPSYAMLAGDAKILAAEPVGALDTPEIRCMDRLYKARLSLLRNRARAGPEGERVTVRINGGLTNRTYKAVFDAGNAGSLPVALFLLYLTVTLRRKAYVTERS